VSVCVALDARPWSLVCSQIPFAELPRATTLEEVEALLPLNLDRARPRDARQFSSVG
jgi:hypothetical protein